MTTGHRVNYLDGLRGILAVVVFIHHFLYSFTPDVIFGGTPQEFLLHRVFGLKRLIALTPINLFFNTGMAITFFFLLSGYVQTISYFRKNDLTILQRSFFKRYFRLAIPTIAVLIMIYVTHRLHQVHNDRFPQNSLSTEWARSLLPDNLNFFQVLYEGIFNCFAGKSNYYQVLWTMPIELANSYLVLLLAMATHQLKNRNSFFLLWLGVQLFVLHSYNGAAFTVGMLFANLQTHSETFSSIFSKPLARFLCWIIGIYFASYPTTAYEHAAYNSVYRPISFFDNYAHIISYLIGVTLMFCALLHSPRIQKLLTGRVLQFYGDVSFMFYLVHLLLLFSFSPWLYLNLLPKMSFGTNMIITSLTLFILTTGVSYALFRLVDQPVLDLCNKYTKKIFGV